MEIQRLQVDLITDDKLLMFYRENYNFITVSYENGRYTNIPIIMGASLNIEKEGIKFPWDEYINGFVTQYESGLPKPYINNDQEREMMIYRYTGERPNLPSISYKNGKERYYQTKKIREYGKYMALCFMAWEIVITGCNNKIIDARIDNYPFTEEQLTRIHTAYNGELWERLDLVPFIQSFQGKGNKIKIPEKGQAKFCYLLGRMESIRKKQFCSDYKTWVKNTFGIDNYKEKRDQRKKVKNDGNQKIDLKFPL